MVYYPDLAFLEVLCRCLSESGSQSWRVCEGENPLGLALGVRNSLPCDVLCTWATTFVLGWPLGHLNLSFFIPCEKCAKL